MDISEPNVSGSWSTVGSEMCTTEPQDRLGDFCGLGMLGGSRAGAYVLPSECV